MSKIQASIVADSICPRNHRITSLLCEMPRFILSEINTHRLFSRNSASSRAVPLKTMIKKVRDDCFVPVAWQKDHSGMQGTEYIINEEERILNLNWKNYSIQAADNAEHINRNGATKQICNRLLEPFMWHQALITSTEMSNFIKLRSSKYEFRKMVYRTRKQVMDVMKKIDDGALILSKIETASIVEWLKMNEGQAEIHLMLLVEEIIDAMEASKPKELKEEEWHIPFGDQIEDERVHKLVSKEEVDKAETLWDAVEPYFIKIATARCARTSYINYEGKDDYEADLKLFDNLSKQGHWSPFEHCAKVMTKDEYEAYTHTTPIYRGKDRIISGVNVHEGWCRNFRGFISLRAMMDGDDYI